MEIEWEEQQFTFWEEPAHGDDRLILQVHSIAKNAPFHVLTDIYVTPSPPLRERWKRMIKEGIGSFVSIVALDLLKESAKSLGSAQISLTKPSRKTLVIEDKRGWGYTFVV